MEGAPFERLPWQITEEFRIAQRFQDPDRDIEDDPELSGKLRVEVDEFIQSKRTSSLPLHDDAVRQQTSPYSRRCEPYEIRILEVFPGDFADAIQGTLHYASVEFDYTPLKDSYPVWKRTTRHAVSLLEGKPVCYTALSYVWGAPIFDCNVHIDGYSKRITRSLDTAIRYLRQKHCSVMLWIDQLCIDQADAIDKAQQVQQMGLVYQRAYNTVIWLGEGPDQRALDALRNLSEAVQGREENVGVEERESLRSRTNEKPGAFEALTALFNSPWFRRTWTIQEAILSNTPYIKIGSSASHWEDFGGYCLSIANLGIIDSQTSTRNDALGTTPIAHSFSGLEVAAQLWKTRTYYKGHQMPGNILYTLVETRYAEVTSPVDKVYAILGLCEHDVFPDYSESYPNVFWQVSLQIIRKELKMLESRRLPGQQTRFYGWLIFQLLCCVDHEHLAVDVPSWVADWTKPRLSTSLGFSTSAASCFDTGGYPLQDVAVLAADGRSLICHAKLWDTIDSLSQIYTDANLSADDPSENNKTLQSAIVFATSRYPTPQTTENGFLSFCKTMVAGKSGSGREKYPDEYTQIFSLLCDETSGKPKPTFVDQIYSPRQKSGHFKLANLKARSTSRAFEDLKKAHEAAMVNRRLCWTKSGFLGLVPRYARESDCIAVFPGSAVPFILRGGNRQDEFRLVGESYINAIMNGEAIAQESLPLLQIKLV